MFNLSKKLQSKSVLVPLIVACALFMEIMDGSIISTALPIMAKSFGVEPQHLSMAITSYLLALATFIPLSGWIADRYGTRTVFRAAIALFTISSVGCALSGTLLQLIVARTAQGISGAMMVPVGRLALLRTVPKNELVDAWAWLTFPAFTAPIIGPLVGGFIVTYLTWHWIFIVNVPIGMLGIVLVTKYIEDIREPNIGPPDILGFIFMALGLGGLVFGFETIGRNLVPVSITFGLLLGCPIFFALYFLHAKRLERAGTKQPIVDLHLFKLPTFSISVLGGTLFRISVGGIPFLIPLLLQVGFGMSPIVSGFLTISLAIGSLSTKVVANRILRTYGFRKILLANTWICGFLTLAYILFSSASSYAFIFIVLMAGGFFRSLQFTCLNVLSFADVSQERMSAATTLSGMMQQLSFSLGVGFSALCLSLTQLWTGHTQLSAPDFVPTIVGVAIVSTSALFYYRKLALNAGAEVSGHQA